MTLKVLVYHCFKIIRQSFGLGGFNSSMPSQLDDPASYAVIWRGPASIICQLVVAQDDYRLQRDTDTQPPTTQPWNVGADNVKP